MSYCDLFVFFFFKFIFSKHQNYLVKYFVVSKMVAWIQTNARNFSKTWAQKNFGTRPEVTSDHFYTKLFHQS